jgi:uncharacterized repeat protein (TIGR03843 family)
LDGCSSSRIRIAFETNRVTELENVLTCLNQGEITVKGEFLWGSNYTFLVEVAHDQLDIPAVYKPVRGERPLWDFPASSLAKREAAAFLVSEALGWRLVPPTVYRRNAPLGPGSVQLYIDHDPDYHYFNFTQQDLERLRPVAALDLVINNADRKGSHILKSPDDRLWLIDHGVCFHREDKLRTVIWDFCGERLSTEVEADLQIFRQRLQSEDEGGSPLFEQLLPYIHSGEIEAMGLRIDKLLQAGVFPYPDPKKRQFPWPQI